MTTVSKRSSPAAGGKPEAAIGFLSLSCHAHVMIFVTPGCHGLGHSPGCDGSPCVRCPGLYVTGFVMRGFGYLRHVDKGLHPTAQPKAVDAGRVRVNAWQWAGREAYVSSWHPGEPAVLAVST